MLKAIAQKMILKSICNDLVIIVMINDNNDNDEIDDNIHYHHHHYTTHRKIEDRGQEQGLFAAIAKWFD